MTQHHHSEELDASNHGSLSTYVIGFVLSLILTYQAYVIVAHHMVSRSSAVPIIIVLAIIQLFVQLVFFLHLNKGSKPRWNLTVLMFAALVVVILVLGSIWIMSHLNYNTMPQDILQYTQQQEAIPQ